MLYEYQISASLLLALCIGVADKTSWSWGGRGYLVSTAKRDHPQWSGGLAVWQKSARYVHWAVLAPNWTAIEGDLCEMVSLLWLKSSL